MPSQASPQSHPDETYRPFQTPPSNFPKGHRHQHVDSGYWSLPSPETDRELEGKFMPIKDQECITRSNRFESVFSDGSLNIFLPEYSPTALENSTLVVTRKTWDQLVVTPEGTPPPRQRLTNCSRNSPYNAGQASQDSQITQAPGLSQEHHQLHISSTHRPFAPSLAAIARNASNLILIRTPYQRPPELPCPSYLNTVAWITNIPGTSTVADILSAVRTGKVFAIHINPPTGSIGTAACKIQFFTRAGLIRFLDQAWSANGIVIRGARVVARENRNMRAPHRLMWQSRAVEIHGPEQMMGQWLFSKFEQFFEFQLEGVKDGGWDQKGRKIQTWYFGSLRAQAESAVMLIERDDNMKSFEARFAEDPCADGRFYD